MVEKPSHFAARKIRVDHESRALLDQLGVPCGFEAIAELRSAPILPHNRVVNRLARFPIPEDGCFALIGNPDTRDAVGGKTRLFKCGPRRVELRLPYFVRVVLDPAGLGEDLPELLLRDGTNGAVLVEDN